MKRLTTDNPQNNLQNALNLFYIKDSETWVRGGGPGPEYADVSLFDFTRQIVRDHAPDIDLPEDNDNLANMMPEWLCDGSDTMEGIIALLYTAAWTYAELRHRLMQYEDTGLEPDDIKAMYSSIEKVGAPLWRLEELAQADRDERLLVLPCKVGDTVWILDHKFAAEIESISIGGEDGPCFEWTEYDRGFELTEVWDEGYFTKKEIGKTVFLTQEAAEAAMKGGAADE